MVYIMYMYVNKRVELAQRGIALQKIYVLLLLCYRSEKYTVLQVRPACFIPEILQAGREVKGLRGCFGAIFYRYLVHSKPRFPTTIILRTP